MHQWRVLTLIIIIFLLGSGVLTRLFSLQILEHERYSALAQGQHQLYEMLFPERGEIFMQDLSVNRRSQEEKYYPLAINKQFQQIYAVPQEIDQENKEELSQKLSELLEMDKEVILQRISKSNDPYEPLKHKVNQEVANQIKELAVQGIKLAPETWRYYPNSSLASHLIGFVGIDGERKVGQYGIEGYYEDELKGEVGFLTGEKDTTGYWIPSLNQEIKPAEDGSDLILTIDQNIQFKAEKELSQIAEKLEAEAGEIIIMEAKTGAIWAMTSWPWFNPNEYNQVEDVDIFLNPVVQKVYEPGSVFKPITMSIGVETNRVSPSTIYHDQGQVWIRNTKISNVDGRSYGDQTMTQVLEKSLNTGAVFVQQTIGEKLFQDYIQRFNFHKKTGVDLVGEVNGDISNLFTGREINLANISFGQGITVTPLGLVAAIGAIANDGKIMRPYVVKKIIGSDGNETMIEPKVVTEVISPETAETLTSMMVSVVDNGYGKPASVAGYEIAGKTGTAQMADLEQGGYLEEDTIHSFIGFAPAYDPEFIILIRLDKPQIIRFAADSTGPVFSRLAEYLFNYLEIPPQ